MSFWVYILRSLSRGRFYCGHTSDLERRLSQHNDPEYQLSRTTKVFKGPWKLVWTGECNNRSEAMKLEKSIPVWGVYLILPSARLFRAHRVDKILLV